MPELIAHLFGDYVVGQDHWMAGAKASSWRAAAAHALLYTLCFLFVTRSPLAILVILSTHFVIDRYRLAKHWCDFWGVGKPGLIANGRFARWVDRLDARDADARATEAYEAKLAYWLVNFKLGVQTLAERPHPGGPIGPRGVAGPAPDWLAAWLMIIVDNSAHLLINHLAIAHL